MLDLVIKVHVAGLPVSEPLLQFTEDVSRIHFLLDESVEAGTLYIIRPDGATCAVTMDGTQELVGTIPAEATELPGRLRFALRATNGSTSRVIWYAESAVRQTSTDTVATAGTMSVAEIEKLIERCELIVNGGVGGVYPTLEALQAAVPNPLRGERYLVGAAYPYAEYTWDAVGGAWVLTRTGAEQLVVERRSSASTPCAAGTATVLTVDAAKAGYTPIGIIGYSLGGTGVRMCAPVRFNVAGNTATVQVNNFHTAAVNATATVDILYAPGSFPVTLNALSEE